MPRHARHTGPSNRGEATLQIMAATVTIRHGLVHQPRIVLCNPSQNVGDCWITNINGTYFTFNCGTPIGARCSIYWYVE